MNIIQLLLKLLLCKLKPYGRVLHLGDLEGRINEGINDKGKYNIILVDIG